VKAADSREKKKVPKQFVICVSDTVAYEWTVMVHLYYALFANLAVMSPRWLDALAFIAIPELHYLLNYFRVIRHVDFSFIVSVVMHIHYLFYKWLFGVC
jgi:hypothetical protein